MPTFEAEALDVGADRFRYAQAVQREQTDEGMVFGTSESSGNQHRGRPRRDRDLSREIRVQTRAPHVHRGDTRIGPSCSA